MKKGFYHSQTENTKKKGFYHSVETVDTEEKDTTKGKANLADIGNLVTTNKGKQVKIESKLRKFVGTKNDESKKENTTETPKETAKEQNNQSTVKGLQPKINSKYRTYIGDKHNEYFKNQDVYDAVVDNLEGEGLDLATLLNYTEDVPQEVKSAIYSRLKSKAKAKEDYMRNSYASFDNSGFLETLWAGGTTPEEYVSERNSKSYKKDRAELENLLNAINQYDKYGNAIELSHDELMSKYNELKSTTDSQKNADALFYLSLANQKQYQTVAKEMSKIKIDGENISVLEALDKIANSDDAKEKNNLWEKSKAKFEEQGYDIEEYYPVLTGDQKKNFDSMLKWAGNTAGQGLSGFTSGIASTADLLLGTPLEAIGWKNNPFHVVSEKQKTANQNLSFNRQFYSDEMGGGKFLDIGGDVLSGVTGALPDLVLAYATAGASKAGTMATSTVTKATGILSKAGYTASNMAKNPNFWLSTARTLGTSYEKAKESGADDITALYGALLESFINAGIEVGVDGTSGIQGLAQEVAEGNSKRLYNWIKSALDEGKEEVLQGLVSRGTEKYIYGGNVDVIQPKEMLKEAGLGTAIGGILGAPTLINTNPYAETGRYLRYDEKGNEQTDVIKSIIDEGLNSPTESQSFKLATKAQEQLDNGKKISDSLLGQLYQANIDAIKAENTPSIIDDEDGNEDVDSSESPVAQTPTVEIKAEATPTVTTKTDTPVTQTTPVVETPTTKADNSVTNIATTENANSNNAVYVTKDKNGNKVAYGENAEILATYLDLPIRKSNANGEKAVILSDDVVPDFLPFDIVETDTIQTKANIKSEITPTVENTPSVTSETAQPTATKGVTSAYTNDNQKIDLRYKVVSVDDLIVSNNADGAINPNYPQKFQPRDRTRGASLLQVQDIAKNVVPEKLGESVSVSEGAPIVYSDNIVESGNGRTMALALMYEINPEGAKKYTDFIIANAEKFGIDVSNLPKNPVLVRERLTEVDRVEFVKKANESSLGAMSATELAKSDSERLTSDILNLLVPNDDGNINTQDNKDFISSIISNVFSKNDLNRLIGTNGMLSANGLERIRNALFYKAYGDASLASRLAESLDNDIKNITNVLVNIAPKIVAIKNDIANGILYDLDFSQDIVDGVNYLQKAKEAKLKVEIFANQISIEEDTSNVVKAIAYIFEQKNRGAKQATLFFNHLCDTIKNKDPKQITFLGDDKTPTKEDVVSEAIARYNNDENATGTPVSVPSWIIPQRSEQSAGENDTGRIGDNSESISEQKSNDRESNRIGEQQGYVEEATVVGRDESTQRPSERGTEDSRPENNRNETEVGAGKDEEISAVEQNKNSKPKNKPILNENNSDKQTPTETKNIKIEPNESKIEDKATDATASKDKGTNQIAEYVANKLAKGEKITALELAKVSSEAFGGTMADNAYSVKDAYDAMELGVNKYILSMKDVSAEKMLELLELLPTQTKRTEDMVKFQQFSTPPSIAYLANYVANVTAKDIMLEPSAGIGGIAVFAKRDGATVYVNELDKRRLEVLRNMPFDRFFNENAEQLDNILGGKIEPTVIVMNPPFSSSSERNVHNTKIGAKHIEQALKILAPNGRLVAIVGKGMEDGAPAFRDWWKNIKSEYNVRANIRIDGKNYNKYGTNFDIQMLVIDKDGATTHTETGYVNTLQELQGRLEGIRDERPTIDYKGIEQKPSERTRTKASQAGKATDVGVKSVSGTDSNTDNGKSSDTPRPTRKSGTEALQTTDTDSRRTDNQAPKNADVVDVGQSVDGRGELGGRTELQDNGRVGISDSRQHSKQSDVDRSDGNVRTRQNGVGVQRPKRTELTDSIFEQYQTQPLQLKNTKSHPARVSESAAMSAIAPPAVTYKPHISQDIIEKGVVSDVQLEAISYAGQSHSQVLPNGTTRGFFLGDGTGIGKGRTIAGMILDNYNQGRKKAIWVTLNPSLVNDAKRDVKALFGDSDLVVQFEGGGKANKIFEKDEAILVVSYTTLSRGYDKKGSNFEKIIEWLGNDFDGLIVFDEAHKMGNATGKQGARGGTKPSQTGLAGIALQEALPKSRVVYSSATGATEVENLRYAERLGLWGEGTPFVTGNEFVSKIKAGGLASMELIARDMKAMGVYLSRNISYDDVQYDKITHELTPEQTKIYDELAHSWQIVLQNINKALESTNQGKDGHARGRALGAFWSSQQRFFNQILTSMQVPSVISDIEKQLADGKSCVIQLVSTNESAQNQEFERLKSEDLDLDEFDLTPKQVLMSMIENSFPVQQFEEYRDDEGKVRSKPVYDSMGTPVLNREAIRQRDELLDKLGSIKVPSSPLDMIINHFGTDLVAENTGRARRVIQRDGKTVEEKIGNKKDADVDAFQNGNKRIIIFSKAGGTGKSYHADKSAKNQQQRVHYLLEAGWQADNAVQGFGRSHRSNQASAPIFKLVTTNLKGQMRFISTIAKRLDQLGAMTKGQRQAGGQGMFSASDNLENSFASDVLAVFYKDLLANRVDGIDNGLAIIEKLGIKDKILDEYGRISVTAPELREVNKFLNRILSLESTEQNTVFEGYSQRLQEATEKAMADGTLDKGLENYKADKITLNEVQDIREDERSGAKTKYYNLTAEHRIKPVKFESINTDSKSFVGFYKNKNTGVVRAVMRTSSTTDQYGNVTDNYKLVGQVKNEYIPQHRLYGNWAEIKADEAEKTWNEELKKLPEFRKESLHLISGVVLPVWDKLPTENVRIYRVLTSDGELLIGRVVSEDMIDETLRRLGSSRKREKIATKDLIEGIKNGDTAYLENDWKIVQRKVSGENRIELVGVGYQHYEILKEKGVFAERIQYVTRYFVPTNTNTEKIIDEILKISPVYRVENAKYSMSVSEGYLNEQTRNNLLSENSEWGIDESTRKQTARLSDFKQKIKGKAEAERKSFAKKLLAEGQTEEVIEEITDSYGKSKLKYNLVKPEAYNDDMLSIVKEAKANGKEVGFFVGFAQRAFTDFEADAMIRNSKILLRYDGYFSPQTLIKHEEVHDVYETPEMQKAKDMILNDLSETEKKKILSQERYKNYMLFHKGNVDKVWEEFVADIFAGMSNYTIDYIDMVSNYWYDGEVVDNFKVSEYAESIDAGGVDGAVLDSATNYANTFYSYMAKVVDDIKQDKLGADSVVNMLRGKGVKAEEIKWSGIETFLEGKKSVTKAELQEFVAGSMLQIEENIGEGGHSITLEPSPYGDDSWYVMRGGEIFDTVEWNENSEMYESDSTGLAFLTKDRILDYYKRDESGDTRWSEYTLDGGSNYREFVFKMPNSSYTNNAMKAHWGNDATGVLAHARVQDFETDNGTMLFIEEIQSDWHNEGSKLGYGDKISRVEELETLITQLRGELVNMTREGALSSLIDKATPYFSDTRDYAINNLYSNKYFDTDLVDKYDVEITADESVALSEFQNKLEELSGLQKELRDFEWSGKKPVPDAPFRNNYHEYVLKRLLRMAVENGYDSIGWTTADIQSDRWSDEYAEGYRIEYDQDIPKFLNKYGKKWGAKVGKTEIGKEDGGWYEVEGTEVWSMPITDSMKDSVLYEGQPMYSFSTAESDIEELTPERSKEIFDEFEKNRVVTEKAPLKQRIVNWFGERGEWIGHNIGRVFPDIPERGEKGTFFAEFRKNMIQWSKLPQTASFMTQDKLNQMTKDLTPAEYGTFSELVYFLDLQEEAQIQKERGFTEILLPNEITPSEVDAIVKVLNEEATENVKQALIKRQEIWNALKTQYIELNRFIGFETEGKFKRKNYYHHQVIDYMNKGGKGTGNREISIKAGRGWLKERQGSTMAINTDFLAVEYQSMLQMQYDVYIAETLCKIKEQYDIKPQLEVEARNSNKKALNAIIREEATDKDGNMLIDDSGKPNSETYRQQMWYNSRIMRGFDGLFDLAERNELPTYDGEYAGVVEALKRNELNVSGLYKYVGILASTELPENATDAQEQAVINARTILKYTSQKREWVKSVLGDNYNTWETIAKSMGDTHTVHQPRRGNYFYTKTVVDEEAFNQAYNEMVLSLASGDVDFGNKEINELFTQYADTVRLMGVAYEQWVLPKEIVKVMGEIANPKQVKAVAKTARTILTTWKSMATGLNPFRTVKYGVRNLLGDLDAVIAGKPQVVKYSKKAVQDIYQAMRHKNYSPEFMEWVERGGYSSMQYINEMDVEMQDKLFSHLKDKSNIGIFKTPLDLLKGYANGVETIHNFREAILRYSSYLYFKEVVERDNGNVKDNVASNRYIVRGLNTIEDKAYQLSKDLLGAYDEVGKMGQTLRQFIIPFYSFTETNIKRYFRMFENVIMSDDKIPKKAGKLLLKALMVNMLTLLITVWNRLVMDEEDDKLPPSARNVPHITLGQIGDETLAFTKPSSFSDILEWFGFEDYKFTSEDWTAPVDKAWGMITPFIKTPIELTSGLNFYPSLTQPRVIRDKWQHIFNSWGLAGLYNEVTGKPTKGWGDLAKSMVVYSYDYEESAYYEILDIKRKYQGDTDNTIYGADKKSNALYYMKQAVKYKDEKAAYKYLDEYFENGGTARGIKQSLAMLNPLYGYTSEETYEKGVEFIASLSEEEKEKLKIAHEYYEKELMLPENVLAFLGKKGVNEETAKTILRAYIQSKCKKE